jgi:hypothetical protein
MSENKNNTNTNGEKRTVTEEMELAGNQVVERLQDMVRQGNVRRVIIKTADDKVLLDTTLTVGALAGGAMALIWWPFAAIAAIAAALQSHRCDLESFIATILRKSTCPIYRFVPWFASPPQRHSA